MNGRCDECGAPAAEWTCEELFHQLLALDHQRAQPWAAYHGINVACYVLQHPSTVKPHQRGAQLELVLAFCEDGLDKVQRLTTSARRQNTHRAPRSAVGPQVEPSEDLVPTAPRHPAFGTTIHDVAVDGTFPADGFARRVEQWAHAIRAAWPTNVS